MKKLSFLAVMTTAALVATICCGCVYSFVTGDKYDNAENYNIGSKTYDEDISCVEIDWKCGKLTLGNGDKVSVEENQGSLNDQQRVRSIVENGVLKVQFWASEYSATVNSTDKTVKVIVPPNIDVKIVSTSGQIVMNNIKANNVTVGKMSGSLEIDNIDAKTVDIDTTSGSIKIGSVTCQKLIVDSTSGSVRINDMSAAVALVGSTSGSVKLTIGGVCEQFELNVTSGNSELHLADAKCGATIEHSTVSGKLNIQADYNVSGGKSVVGSGKCKMSLHATSGKITVDLVK